jgi:excisionase family DNA binding protein
MEETQVGRDAKAISSAETIVKALREYPTFLTKPEVAEILRVNVTTVGRLIARGFLTSVKITPGAGPRRVRVAKTELERFLCSSTAR